jgi:hypothetical protein
VAWAQKVKCGCARIGVTPITTTIGVVALHNGANPILRVAGALHDLLGGLTLSEQPENLPLAARDGIARLTVPLFQLVRIQIWNALGTIYRLTERIIPWWPIRSGGKRGKDQST